MWFGPHAAHGTCYVPLPAGAAAVPDAYTVADPRKLSRASAYWAHKVSARVRVRVRVRVRPTGRTRLVSG